MKTEAMVRRLPTPWAQRRPAVAPETNSVPAVAQSVAFGGVLSNGPETKPFQNWYRDRCAGMGRALGGVRSEGLWAVHAAHPDKGAKHFTVNAQSPREAHAKASAKVKGSGHKVVSVKFKEWLSSETPVTSYYQSGRPAPAARKLTDAEKASVKKLQGIYKKLKVEGGPGSGRYPKGSGGKNTPADQGTRAAKADAVALRDISNHPKLMDRINVLAKQAIKGAQNYEDVESNVADLVHRDSGLAKEIQASAKLMLGSRYDKVGKEMRYDMEDRVQRDAEEEIVARAIEHFKKGENLQAEGGPGSGRYPAGSGKSPDTTASSPAHAGKLTGTTDKYGEFHATLPASAKAQGISDVVLEPNGNVRLTIHGVGVMQFKQDNVAHDLELAKSTARYLNGEANHAANGRTFGNPVNYLHNAGKEEIRARGLEWFMKEMSPKLGRHESIQAEGGPGSGRYAAGSGDKGRGDRPAGYKFGQMKGMLVGRRIAALRAMRAKSSKTAGDRPFGANNSRFARVPNPAPPSRSGLSNTSRFAKGSLRAAGFQPFGDNKR